MSAVVYYPVHELAGVQEDPLAECVLARLYTDRPVRSSMRPGDTRRHWQFFARTDTENFGSKLWVLGEPFTDDTVRLMKSRAENALAALVGDGSATSIEVTVRQTAVDAAVLDVLITRPNAEDLSLGVALQQGGD